MSGSDVTVEDGFMDECSVDIVVLNGILCGSEECFPGPDAVSALKVEDSFLTGGFTCDCFLENRFLTNCFMKGSLLESDGVSAAASVSGDGLSWSCGSRSSNMNSISSDTLSSRTWGSMKTILGRMSRK